MNTTAIIGVIGIFVTIACNIALCAYFIGTLNQKVSSNTSAIQTLAQGMIKTGEHLSDLEGRVKTIEIEVLPRGAD